MNIKTTIANLAILIILDVIIWASISLASSQIGISDLSYALLSSVSIIMATTLYLFFMFLYPRFKRKKPAAKPAEPTQNAPPAVVEEIVETQQPQSSLSEEYKCPKCQQSFKSITAYGNHVCGMPAEPQVEEPQPEQPQEEPQPIIPDIESQIEMETKKITLKEKQIEVAHKQVILKGLEKIAQDIEQGNVDIKPTNELLKSKTIDQAQPCISIAKKQAPPPQQTSLTFKEEPVY